MLQKHFVNFLAVFIGVFALIIMCDWLFGLPLTRQILTVQGNYMKFSTAMMFFVSSIGLFFISWSARGKNDITIVILPEIAFILLLFITVISIAVNFNSMTGLEGVFINELNNQTIVAKSAPSFLTLINFTVFAFACLIAVFSKPNIQKLLLIMGSFIFISALIAISGYIFKIPSLYSSPVKVFNNISLISALLFACLGSGIIISSTEQILHDN